MLIKAILNMVKNPGDYSRVLFLGVQITCYIIRVAKLCLLRTNLYREISQLIVTYSMRYDKYAI